MSALVSAPLLTAALFFVCFMLSVFFRLAVGKPAIFRDEPQKTKPRRSPAKKVYFIADLKPVIEERDLFDEKDIEKRKNRVSR